MFTNDQRRLIVQLYLLVAILSVLAVFLTVSLLDVGMSTLLTGSLVIVLPAMIVIARNFAVISQANRLGVLFALVLMGFQFAGFLVGSTVYSVGRVLPGPEIFTGQLVFLVVAYAIVYVVLCNRHFMLMSDMKSKSSGESPKGDQDGNAAGSTVAHSD
ncbi:hypothetical protein CO180_01570 [candidate division WWE3 bacterium CG_4_9_14_3_um_filter_41_6]|uniref:Uncharacterized protein n=1 Tax=candidate division WWE3 bacterium CG_4_10_14_0_2_um_filter_41_14 TaxID=1975072 RepID=A0A2M7TL27_UNCKA|nr:MAG: hypothetical protein COY32_01185 [candidate division WWE3 bacterium CG_4_10_14_0_2_um_filter_41_14]PJA39104.1 MAG: hypothetical protein CO180_01570 [candidate division WWE3 bacterium CG_4_9_14_3_um_filter_41_6]